jgi:hypothetical protein
MEECKIAAEEKERYTSRFGRTAMISETFLTTA